MPERPEVHALAVDLQSRLRGHRIDRLDVFAFHALKTFDPPPTALSGPSVNEVSRRGKFLVFLPENYIWSFIYPWQGGFGGGNLPREEFRHERVPWLHV